MQWKTIDGEKPRKGLTEIEVLLRGMCGKQRLLDIVRNFVVFEKDKETKKKLAAYHQYWATNKAVVSTLAARRGNKKAGIVWHTQGSGKSLTMIFYSGKLVRELDNPTIVVLTDRNDLDGQLFGTFGRCQDILRQKPVQAQDRDDLKKLLAVASGGVVFTTIQKFFPESKGGRHPLLSERRNVVVIADEAHRSQYDFIDGFARHMRDALPNASFIGFTGTPIEKTDANTRAVFGDYNRACRNLRTSTVRTWRFFVLGFRRVVKLAPVVTGRVFTSIWKYAAAKRRSLSSGGLRNSPRSNR